MVPPVFIGLGYIFILLFRPEAVTGAIPVGIKKVESTYIPLPWVAM
jgi:hypothetical protein